MTKILGGALPLERRARDGRLCSKLAAHRQLPEARRSEAIETFSPLYLSNECDAECRHVRDAPRSTTQAKARVTATEQTVTLEQLDILHRRGLRGVALLTGEYRHEAR